MSSSYDRSLQSLWKIITGNSAITDHELILKEVKSVKDVLKEGLDFFRTRSSKSESKLKSSKLVKGRKLDFILEISKCLVLDEMQCLGLFQNFLTEGYRGSFSEINQKLANNTEKKLLLRQVEEYYNKERLNLLRCLKQFFGYWQDGNHPYRKVYERTLVLIEFDGNFIPKIWKQFQNLSLLDLPLTIESADEESKWLRQNALEQIELLELLLLFYKDYEMSIDKIIGKFNTFQRICFGLAPRGRYTSGMADDPLSQHLSFLCVLVLLAGLDLEYSLQIQDKVKGASSQDHHISNTKPNVYQKCLEFENLLKDTNHASYHTPLLLAWFILRYMLYGDDEDINNAQTLGNVALQNDVFGMILKMLRSPFFSGDRPVAGVCQSIYYTVVSLAVSLFSESSLGNIKLLYEIASFVLDHPRMRLTFWEKAGNYYISCPTCRVDHLVPEGGATNLPNAFQINSFLDLRRRLVTNTTTKPPLTNCPKHNDLLRVYCVTCNKVICQDCTISTEHETHDYSLIDECYPNHHQQIETNSDLVKHKMADLNTAVTQLDTTEKEVIEQGEQIQEQINTHAQNMIDKVKRSCQQLSQQLHNIVKKKKQFLTTQKQQAQLLHTQLNTCLEMIDHSLKEWTKQQILTDKHTLINQMNIATQHVDPTVFQPIEKADMKFTKTCLTENGIGFITSTTYGKAILYTSPGLAKRPSTATLTLHSQDGSHFPLPPSLISSTLSSPGIANSGKCDITQTDEEGNYKISFIPSTRQDRLLVQLGGVDIPDSPLSFTLPVIPTPEMRGEPINTMTELNKPHGIAVCDNGDIVVADYSAHCLTILNKEGEKVRSIGTKEGQFTEPCGVAITNDGHIFVTDDHRIRKLTTDGVCVNIIGSCGSGRLQFNNPRGITVHPATGRIFVADCANNRIQVFNCDLTFSYTITRRFTKSFDHPYDVALDNEGYLYVAEYGNHCITKLTTKGEYTTRFGSPGSAPGQLCHPSSLTINNGLVYVSEMGNNRVSIFNTNGKFHHCFGKRGSGEGKFSEPHGITIDALGNLYVSDTNNNRIVVY